MSEAARPPQSTQIDAGGAAARRPLWRTVRDALAGAEHDYTTGSLSRAVILLAIPMVLEMVMESVFAICDVFFVSRLGVEAVAAVGLTEAVLTIFYAVAMGVATAATAMVARRVGEGDRQGAATATVQAVVVGIGVWLLVGVPLAVVAPDVLRLMGASEATIDAGAGYTTVLFAGSLTVLLLFLINASFRGAGDAATAMRVLWLANGVNLVLDPCLIFGLGPFPELGVTGAAVATTIGRGAGVVMQVVLLLGPRGRLRVRLADLGLQGVIIVRLLRVSLGGVGQFLIATASWVALMRLVGNFGSAAVAGYTIAIRIVVFALLPSWGLANAAATLVGQSLGAGQPERAERSTWIAAVYNVAFLLVLGCAFVAAAPALIRLFSSDPVVIDLGGDCLRWLSYGFPLYGVGMVVVQAFNGAGDTATPTYANLACYWLFQIPLAYGLALAADLHAHGVFVAVPVAEALLAVVAVLLFRRRRWQAQRI